MTQYSQRLTEALEKAEQGAVMASDDATEALAAATDADGADWNVRRLLKQTIEAVEEANTALRTIRRLAHLAIVALILSAPGCATARSQLVATWEPQPDVRVAYCVDLGNVPRINSLTERQ